MILGGGQGREGPRLAELSVTTSSYGMPIPRHYGRMRVAGQVIWATDLVEHKETQGGGKGAPSVTTYTYSVSFAVALASRPIDKVGRIWADGKLLRGASGDMKTGGRFRLHRGTADQPPDPLLASAERAGRCPAYSGLAYAVFDDLQLADFGNRIPALTFEVIADSLPLTVETLVGDVLDETDAAVGLPGVEGLSVEGPVGEMLAALDPLFPMDCDACDAFLTLRPDRRQAAVVALPEAATSTEKDDFGGNAGYARKRGPETEQPVAVLRYYDVERDYQPGAQRAAGRPSPGQPRSIELPAALSAASARGLIQNAAKRTLWGRQTVSWRMTQLDPAVRPGATVSLPGHPGLWRVREWEWRSHGVDLTLVRLSGGPADSLAADPGRASTAPDHLLGATELAAFELPWDGNSGTSIPLVMAAASSANGNWSGAALYAAQGDGTLQPLGPSGRTRATIGQTLAALPPASPLVFDRHGFVDVQLISADMYLGGATVRQLAMGANKAIIGEEIIQFGSAQRLADGAWRLSQLLRGRAGTEAAIADHDAGERFVLLDGTGQVLDAEIVGSLSVHSVAAVGLGDAGPVSAPIQLRGIGWRPLSPVHATCTRLADSSRRISWTRRARGAWQWADGVEVPLNEQREAYEVSFGTGDAATARWDVSVPALTIPGDLAESLLAANPTGTLKIRQRGDRAVSLPLELSLS